MGDRSGHGTILVDDGFSLGVVFKGERAVASLPGKVTASVDDIEKQFVLQSAMAGA